MLKKALYGAVICLLSVLFLTPSSLYAVETTPDEEVILYETDDTVVDDAELYNDTGYDWSTWDELEAPQIPSDLETDVLSDEEAAAVGIMTMLFSGVFLVISIIVLLVSYVYHSLTLMVIAQKLNVPNAWLAWVPIANMFTAVQCAGISAWTLLLLIVPFVNIGYVVYLYMKMAERRGFPNWWGILILVPVVQVIVPGYLAWAEPKKTEVAAQA